VLGRGDADAAKLSLLLELAEDLQGLGPVVPRPRPGVKLDDIDAVGLQVAQAALQPFAQVTLGKRSSIESYTLGGQDPGAGGILVAT